MSFEAKQRKFALGSFKELISRRCELHVPSEEIIWHPDTTIWNILNLTSTHPIIFQNYLIDHTLQVTSCHHGARVGFRF